MNGALNAVPDKARKSPATKLPETMVVRDTDYLHGDRSKIERFLSVKRKRRLVLEDDNGKVVAVITNRL